MSTWYISGPMRGIKHFNFDAFRRCEDALWEYDKSTTKVFNPARHDAEVLGMGWEPDETQDISAERLHSWMRKDLSEVAAADIIVLLPGWEFSEGARREVQVARWCGVYLLKWCPEDEAWPFEALTAKYVDAVLTEGVDRGATVRPMKNLTETAFESFKTHDAGRSWRSGDKQAAAFEAVVLERTDVAQGEFRSKADEWVAPTTPLKTLRPNEQNEILGIFMQMLAGPTGDGGNKRARGEKPCWKDDPSHYAKAIGHLHDYDERYDAESGCNHKVHAAWRLLAVAYQEMVEDGLLPEDPK